MGLVLGLALVAFGCEEPERDTAHAQDHVAAARDEVTHGVAVLHPTEGNEARGVVRFTSRDGEVRVTADLEGIPPGRHGFHVHQLGDCSAPDASSAGDHFDPEDEPHALPPAEPRHAGDLGNIDASSDGRARYEANLHGFTIGGGENAVLGRAVIVHADPDTGQGPSGESGARIACGVIGVAAPPG